MSKRASCYRFKLWRPHPPRGEPPSSLHWADFYPLPDPPCVPRPQARSLERSCGSCGGAASGRVRAAGAGARFHAWCPRHSERAFVRAREDVGIDAPKRYSCRKCMMKRSPQMMGTLWCGAPPECASRAGGAASIRVCGRKNGYTVLTCRLHNSRKRCCDPERGPSVSAQPTRLPLGDTAPRGSVITARRLDTASAVHSMVE